MLGDPRTRIERRADMLCAYARRGIFGARTQRERMSGSDSVPSDLDFYAFAAWQLREAGRQAKNRMPQVPEIKGQVAVLLDDLDAAIPGLKTFRDEMTHAIDDINEDHAQFGSFVGKLLPGGGVHYILDSRYNDQEALEDFFAALVAILEPHGTEITAEGNQHALEGRLPPR